MPEASSFTTANTKLPDPFTKMDGSRIKDKGEWACRREEILRQGFKYIYGDKPIPATVTGTVSTSSISVTVTEGGKTAKITATVSMNGATQPAPAIITYGGSGASAPSGVAKINYSPTETQGGSGAKSGAFFTIYGSNHPAGYMVSNAWEVSRIIDVLEQNPGIIDPYRLGVTGCSRWGKGAFVAGVLDNRIALTIPVESGIGGTVALRLVEQLDTGGEWPYHAISYVRWLSEVALGPFTSGNSASADNTAKLPVDMHEMMALIAPRGLYIVDNPSTNYAGLDRNSAWVTGNVGKVIFEALGVGDNFAYQGASGGHCQWRSQYTASLNAMVDKFLKGNASAKTGTVATDFSGPDPKKYYDWTPPTLSGEL
ncbi:MAG: PE PGRS family protein [Deltaproteobacteria bacterium]|nr:PE PGRS family protein [Deltaproteobacteria bacterium]